MVAALPHAVDTNMLLRNIETSHPQHQTADQAITRLKANQTRLCIFPQNIREFWDTCTRPADKNGLGKSIAEADVAVAKLEMDFEVLEENAAIYREWRRLVVQHQVSGAQVHDTNIAAAMNTYGIKYILTFNGRDFARFTNLVVVDPATI